MKTIKVFLSTTCDLEEERRVLVDLASLFNSKLGKDVCIQPIICEHMPLCGRDFFEEYENVLRECDRCIFLVGKKIGKYLMKELDEAFLVSREFGKPNIDVMFKFADEKELDEYPDVKSLYEERFKRFYLYPIFFTDIESFKIKSLSCLSGILKLYVNVDSIIQVESGCVTVCDETFLELSQLKAYSNNEDLKELENQISITEELLAVIDKDSQDYDKYSSCLEWLRNKQSEMEKGLWYMTVELASMGNVGCSNRTRRIIEMLENGEMKGVNALLREGLNVNDVHDDIHKIAIGREGIEGLKNNISEYKIKIDVIKALKEEGWVGIVIDMYDKIFSAANGFLDDSEMVKIYVDYFDFLFAHKKYELVEKLCSDNIPYYEKKCHNKAIPSSLCYVILMNNLGKLHCAYGNYKEAEREYKEALSILREMNVLNAGDDENSDLKLCLMTTTYNLAVLQCMVGNYTSAEEKFLEVLKLSVSLNEVKSNKYNFTLASTLSNIAKLYVGCCRYEESQNLYLESICIFRQLCEIDADEYLPYLTLTQNELANLYFEIENISGAEHLFYKVIENSRRLYDIDSEEYMPNLASALYSLANIHLENNQLDEAECELQESLCLNNKMVDNSDASFASKAKIFEKLGLLYYKKGSNESAVEYYLKALGLWKQLCEDNNAYLLEISLVYNVLSVLYESIGKQFLAEDASQKALEIMIRLDNSSSGCYTLYLAMVYNNMASIHECVGKYTESEKEYEITLDLIRKVSEQNPGRYGHYMASVLDDLAFLHLKMNKNQESEIEMDEAQKIRADLKKSFCN